MNRMLLNNLHLDAVYRNTNNWLHADDEFNRFFRFSDGRGINNTSGFRPKRRAGDSTAIVECAFCLLVTNFGETEWPDRLDPESGLFIYYGDNRKPGKAVSETLVGGNRLLESVFARLHNGERDSIPPFLCFESFSGVNGMCMRFLGLAVPGSMSLSSLEDLVAVWRVRGQQRFQNYRATFTILDVASVSHSWLEAIVAGNKAVDADGCPQAFQRWVKEGRYDALRSERKVSPRAKSQQLPRDDREHIVLNSILDALDDRQFEYAAAEILKLMDMRFSDIEVTRAVRDGGRDVLASYRVGHEQHSIRLNACLEAKRWKTNSAVGVKPMMRLISRIKHRDFGVFMTTSFFDRQVQSELIEDGHPVILISGGDIARLLISQEVEGDALARWLDTVRTHAAQGF